MSHMAGNRVLTRGRVERVAVAVALLVGLGQTLISAYWAFGGLWAIATVGGAIEDLARSGDARASWLAWGATAAKACGVVLVLLLAARGATWIPRLLLLVAGAVATVVLVLYGGALTVVGALAFAGAIDIPADANRYALGWHLAFWDPLFLVWGLAIGVVTRGHQQRSRSQSSRNSSTSSVSLPGQNGR